LSVVWVEADERARRGRWVGFSVDEALADKPPVAPKTALRRCMLTRRTARACHPTSSPPKREARGERGYGIVRGGAVPACMVI